MIISLVSLLHCMEMNWRDVAQVMYGRCNRLRGLSLPRKSAVRLTDRPDMTLDVYRGRKTTIQQYNNGRCKGAPPYCLCLSFTKWDSFCDFLSISLKIHPIYLKWKTCFTSVHNSLCFRYNLSFGFLYSVTPVFYLCRCSYEGWNFVILVRTNRPIRQQ